MNWTPSFVESRHYIIDLHREDRQFTPSQSVIKCYLQQHCHLPLFTQGPCGLQQRVHNSSLGESLD